MADDISVSVVAWSSIAVPIIVVDSSVVSVLDDVMFDRFGVVGTGLKASSCVCNSLLSCVLDSDVSLLRVFAADTARDEPVGCAVEVSIASPSSFVAAAS